MIGLVAGTLLEKNNSTLLIETSSGVGYEILVTSARAAEVLVGTSVRLYTYLKVSDSAQELFGFATTVERDFFRLLLTVSGIGPKSALNILGLGSIENIQAAIARGDIAYLTGVQGMGKKTAERVVVELKAKLKDAKNESGDVSVDTTGALNDAVDGLMAMGYTAIEARRAVHGLSATNKDGGQLLREALAKIN